MVTTMIGKIYGLGYGGLTLLSTVFHLCHGSQLYSYRKSTDLSRVTDKYYQL